MKTENYKEVTGDLITLAKDGQFDVVIHGANCQCLMGNGIAPLMADAFAVDHYWKEGKSWKGDVNKLGTIDYGTFYTKKGEPCIAYSVNKDNEILQAKGYKKCYAVNCYTQFDIGRNTLTGAPEAIDYEALILCLRKINHEFKGLHIGMPMIGCGLAKGEWTYVKKLIENELKDCEVTIVIFSK